jgi:hypothetical protein
MRPGGRRAISQDPPRPEELMGAVRARLACPELREPSRQDAAPGSQIGRHLKVAFPGGWSDVRWTS